MRLVNELTLELDVHGAMTRVRAAALALLDCERVTLFLASRSRRELRGRTGDGGGIEDGGGGKGGGHMIRLRFGEGVAGHIAARGGLLNVRDAYAHPLFSDASDARTGFRTRNLLCCAVPDAVGVEEEEDEEEDEDEDEGEEADGGGGGGGEEGEEQQQEKDLNGQQQQQQQQQQPRARTRRRRVRGPVAVLQALNKRGGADFSAADERHLRLFSVHLGATIARARLYAEARRERERLAALGRCFKALARAVSGEWMEGRGAGEGFHVCALCPSPTACIVVPLALFPP